MPDNIVRLDIPSTVHPLNLKGTSPAQEHARAALTSLYDVYGTINDTSRQVKDKGRLATTVRPVAEKAITRVEKTMQQIQTSRTALTKQIDDALLTKGTLPQIGAQIRSHFASLPEGKAVTAILALVREGDHTTVASVLQAPGYLSGLTPAHVQIGREAAEAQFASDNVKLRSEADDAVNAGVISHQRPE